MNGIRRFRIDGRAVLVSAEPNRTIGAIADCAGDLVVDEGDWLTPGPVEAIIVSGDVAPDRVAAAGARAVELGVPVLLDLAGDPTAAIEHLGSLGFEDIGWLGDLAVVALSVHAGRRVDRNDLQWAALVGAAMVRAPDDTDEVVRLRQRVSDLRHRLERRGARVERLVGRVARVQKSRDRADRARARAVREKAALERSLAVRLALRGRAFARRAGGRPAVVAAAVLAAMMALALISGAVAWLSTLGTVGLAVAVALVLAAVSLPAIAAVALIVAHGAAMRRQSADVSRQLGSVAERQRRTARGLRAHRAEFAAQTATDQQICDRSRAAQVHVANAVADLTAQYRTQESRRTIAAADQLAQIQSLTHLFASLPVDLRVPPMGGWAASPDLIELLLDEMRVRRPRLVVECGSGVSTLWFAIAIDHLGLDTRVVALEHDETFGAQTRALLERHGLGHIAEVRSAPLTEVVVDGHTGRWYDPAVLSSLEGIGLLLVDGPPAATGPHARFPAVPLLVDAFAPQVSIILDDMIREDEQEVARRWEALLPGFKREDVRLQKRATIFRRG